MGALRGVALEVLEVHELQRRELEGPRFILRRLTVPVLMVRIHVLLHVLFVLSELLRNLIGLANVLNFQ